MKKRILSCFLLISIFMGAILLTACDDKEEAPDGMQSVTLEGEPFVLYVPNSWRDNRNSGISSAYYSTANPNSVVVTARYEAKGDETLSDFVKRVNETYKSYPDYKAEADGANDEGAKLGNKTATKTSFSFTRAKDSITGESKRNVTVIQYTTVSGEYMITLSFFCDTELFNDEMKEVFKQICTNFVVKDNAEKPKAEKMTDENTPKGMQIASHKSLEYIFYVPEAWVVNSSDKLTEAYSDESGRPNVSVTAVQPFDKEGSQTVETLAEYFKKCETMYKAEGGLKGYSRTEEPKEGKVSGVESLSYVYTVKYGEVSYKIMQTIFAKDGNIYSITYTAVEGSYDAHTDDVAKMLDSFKFKY